MGYFKDVGAAFPGALIAAALHELLHAASAFSWVDELREVERREKDTVKGWTEFLTGYVLYRRYPRCYRNWLRGDAPCSIANKSYVRVFAAAAQVYISVKGLTSIYLYDRGSGWRPRYERFLRKYEMNDFLLGEGGTIALASLLREVTNALKRKRGPEAVKGFKELTFKAPLECVLDYSRMLA